MARYRHSAVRKTLSELTYLGWSGEAPDAREIIALA
jgi:hypothetical protein